LYSNLRLRISRKLAEAKRKDIPCDINADYIISLWELQQGRCALTGVEMEITGEPGPNNLSIDRIAPDRGYVRGNVQLVTYRANQSKGNMTINEFTEFCKLVLETVGLEENHYGQN
jgi:hypothetical protein